MLLSMFSNNKMGKLIQTLGLVGALGLAGCLDNSNSDNPVLVTLSPTFGKNNPRGAIVFEDKNNKNVYLDYGYDGTLDEVIYTKDNQRVSITSSAPEFVAFIPKYEAARKKAASQ